MSATCCLVCGVCVWCAYERKRERDVAGGEVKRVAYPHTHTHTDANTNTLPLLCIQTGTRSLVWGKVGLGATARCCSLL